MNQDNIIDRVSMIRFELEYCAENPIDISFNTNIIKSYVGVKNIVVTPEFQR